MINSSKDNPIGIFDSGIGGTSIWKEINSLLPNEDTIYLSDSINAPYGQKTKEEILNLSIKNTEYLIQKKCKIIVVACNTATTNAIKYLRENYNIPFIGIEPAIKPASLHTKTNTIGILATKGTLNSELFEKTSSTINNNIHIVEQIGEGLVELIEAGQIESEEIKFLLKKHLQPMIDQKIDYLVLGCTHYPYLIKSIKEIVGESIKIIDSGEAVARQTKNVLAQQGLLKLKNLRPASSIFYTNKDEQILKELLKDSSPITIEKIKF